jgi:membrane protein DedA with SNARE-associated domain
LAGVIQSLTEFADSFLDWIETFTSSPWFYVVLFAVAFLDSIIPIVPSETTVILGGIAAGQDELSIVLVIVIAAFGAFLGDSTAYALGNRYSEQISGVLFRGAKGQDRLARAGDQIRKRGGLLLITARFVPGGRTALTFSCGLTQQPYLNWFLRWDIVAVVIWASYAGLLGFFFGDRFEDDHTRAFWWAFGTALTVTVLIELVRWLRNRIRPATASS